MFDEFYRKDREYYIEDQFSELLLKKRIETLELNRVSPLFIVVFLVIYHILHNYYLILITTFLSLDYQKPG